jgi:hypothetical protein
MTLVTLPPPDPPLTADVLRGAALAAWEGRPWPPMHPAHRAWLAQVMPGAVRFARLLERFSDGTLEGADFDELLMQLEEEP